MATIVGICVLAVVPATAIAVQPEDPGSQGKGHNKPVTPGPTGEPNGNAYGFHCQDQSKKHVAGEKGTPFSQCVQAMKEIASGATDNPARACKGLSKKKAEGEKRSPFAKCVKAAAKLRGQQSEQPVT
jgi:hypothetical protein